MITPWLLPSQVVASVLMIWFAPVDTLHPLERAEDVDGLLLIQRPDLLIIEEKNFNAM